MAKDRSTVAKKWLNTKVTQTNTNSGKEETHTLEEWMYIANPEWRKLKEKYYAFPKRK
jgi:hypothetical protein